MVFCNNGHDTLFVDLIGVTILILVDGFLQCGKMEMKILGFKGHNPYFSRWFSAMLQ